MRKVKLTLVCSLSMEQMFYRDIFHRAGASLTAAQEAKDARKSTVYTKVLEEDRFLDFIINMLYMISAKAVLTCHHIYRA